MFKKGYTREIDATTEATNGEIIYEAIIDMPYLNAILRKTLSMHPQLSFLERVCTKDHNTKKKPEIFNLDRFIDKKAS